MVSARESRVDVLIVGAGPAGLFLATQLAKLKVNTRIIDKQAHPVLRGHADGLQCRTGEVFTALGIQSRFDEESHECAEVVMWNPNEKGDGIVQTDRVVDTVPGLSHVRHVTLGQDRVEAIFAEFMEKFNNVEVERLTTPTSIQVDEAALGQEGAYPITLALKKLPQPKDWANGDVKSGMYRSNLFATEETAATNGHEEGVDGQDLEIVHCKYVVGCDGARSWVRRQLGLSLEGDSANVYWGAFDAIVKSDLPTLRMKNAVHSANAGSVLMVPREEGMIRVYTQMGELQAGERVNRADVTLEKMLEKTQLAMKPYKLEFPYVDWYTCYEIGQRVCETFSKHQNHIFIAGDACHTHSPKAGQGMNVSMMDTWNLGWKLAMVLRGTARPEVLDTYQQERRAIAQELIDFDYKFSRLFSGKPGAVEAEGITSDAWKEAWDQSIKFTSGTGVVYAPNQLIAATRKQATQLAKNIILGSHFESHQVVEVSTAHAVQLQQRLKGDGRWRLIIFAGDLRDDTCRQTLTRLGKQLGSPAGPAIRFTPRGEDIDSVIETLTVFSTPHRFVQSQELTLPRILLPERKPYGVRAFDTLFTDEPSYHNGFGKAYEGYGIDATVGCIVVTRPDQHVAGVYGLDEFDAITAFFAGFMIDQQ